MGASVIIVPNVYDYWIEIMNPCKELLEVLSHYQGSVIQEVRVMQEERWEYFKISAHLLSSLVNHDQIVKQLLKGTNPDQFLFVRRCSQQETIDQELYHLLQQMCTVVQPKSSPLIIQKCFQNNLLYGFEKPGLILDLHTAFEALQTKECKQLPKEYLLIELKQTYTISKVIEGKSEAIFHSPLSQKLILKIIKQVIGRNLPDELIDTIDSIINDIFEEGNYEKADLLVQDIFGLNNCSIIGLPPKLIASSLAKYSKEKGSTSTIWDQLQSLLVAFALNIGTLAKEQILLTKTPQVIFKTNEIANKVFFSLINTVLAPYGEVWFVKSGNTPLLHSEDILHEKVTKMIAK